MEQTLLLNATYEPLKVVHWQKAITLWCQGKVEVISVYDREIRSVSFSFKLPSVIRLLRYIRIKRTIDYVPFSRANIYARDDHSCQYCGEVFPTAELTFDHVVPVAQGGRKDWENIVTCCITLQPQKGRPNAGGGRHAPDPDAQAPGAGAGDPHHRRSAQRARQLARLLLLEHGARRDLTGSTVAVTRLARPSLLDSTAVCPLSVIDLPEPESASCITAVHPLWAVEGGRVTITGIGFNVEPRRPTSASAAPGALAHASRSR